MPTINALMIIQLCVLMAAFPAQYLLAQWYRTDSIQGLQVIERLISYWNNFRWSYLSLKPWARYLKNQVVKMRNWYNEGEEFSHAYFAEPTRVRSPRPEFVQFNVGMVIIHKQLGFSGVIIGWDVEARGPEEWLKQKYPPEKQHLRKSPHYRILVNKYNKIGLSTAYIPEENLKVITGHEVFHPDLKVYFSTYDGVRYIMQPWLKQIYPDD
ncbi:F-box only protein 21 [Sarcophilus harrisii]|uniref:Hemimethylated DNA-binding domain-containing protein n=1 Tax=Sarcophilus harrisii TaxID=9305 RepID=G3W455_SARHA|nr:F-box only protein 21 [Sarcophilus harrisii]